MTPDEYTHKLIHDVRTYMKEHHITQIELSEKTGIAICTLSHMFNYDRYPHLYTFCVILNALGLDVTFTERKEEPTCEI